MIAGRLLPLVLGLAGSSPAWAGSSRLQGWLETQAPVSEELLSNGLRLVVLPPGGRVDRALVAFPVGAAQDGDRPGTAHLAEHLLFTLDQDGASVEERFAAIGAEGQATTDHHRLQLQSSGPPGTLPELVAIEVSRLTRPLAGVGAGEVAVEAEVIEAERIRASQRAGAADMRALSGLRWGAAHPEAGPVLGEKGGLATATPEELQGWAERWLVAPGTVVVLRSPAPLDAELPGIRAALEALPKGVAEVPAEVPEESLLGHWARTDQIRGTTIYLAWPTPGPGHEDEAALELLAELLAHPVHGGLASLRGVQEVQAWHDLRPAGGTLTVRLRVDGELPELVLDRVDRRLRTLERRGVAPEVVAELLAAWELETWERLLAGGTLLPSTAACPGEAGRGCLAGEVERHLGVGAEELGRALGRTFDPVERITLTVVPWDRPELRPPAAMGVP